MNTAIRVLIADDHPLVRAGINAVLSNKPEIEIVGEATDASQAQYMSEQLKPDVLILDLNMPGPLPVDIVSYLHTHCPEVAVLILSAHDDDASVQCVISAGACGYVLKDEMPETIIQAICSVAQGGSWFSRGVIDKLARLRHNELDQLYEVSLTPRDQQLLHMIAQGWDNIHIAKELSLAQQTVRNYVSHLYVKLNIQSRSEAIVWARERGLGGGYR